jgi:hypothetical protein
MSQYDNSIASIGDITSDEIIANMLSAKAEFDASKRRELRLWSQAIETAVCQRCRRKLTITNQGGDTIHLCESVFRELLRQCRTACPAFPGERLGGIRIVAFPCEPIPRL